MAITLLVLNVKIPGLDSPGKLLSDKDLWPVLLGEWPMLVAYATSFATIGIMWIIQAWRYMHIPLAILSLLVIGFHSVGELVRMI